MASRDAASDGRGSVSQDTWSDPHMLSGEPEHASVFSRMLRPPSADLLSVTSASLPTLGSDSRVYT